MRGRFTQVQRSVEFIAFNTAREARPHGRNPLAAPASALR